ncbi:histidinol-phosphate transaminase [Virgibacillus alimentarius]|uniref:Histidinol-phosphate aminotransferase n=1 Tax=Virgibacillus alimentarius TaxID=698769 RepID=A0ABS4S6Y6_9BACI|nr:MULTISPECIES: histidinol-phosphate transaminase [Virgibacillus]MBP2257246.1 histidinol-phosphate aminotransferase [Virgibacillus alimentarius]HLR67372.1 histidinol-phosphate transaminase [Virgibacillus sp.]
MSKFWSSMVKRTEPYIPGEQLNEENIIKLNTNENPYPPSPDVLKSIQKEMEHKLQLYPSPSVDHLRQAIAAQHDVKKENIFVGNGSDEVLAFSFMAFFEPGKKILFPEITYSFYPVYSKLFNIPFEKIPLNSDFTLPKEEFFQSEGGVIFPNPNAPTGVYLSIRAVEEIVQNNPGCVVVVDEAYIDFASGSAISLINSYDNLLVVQTLSKSRSLAGLRVGFALGNAALIQALTRIKDSFNSYPIDRLAIVGAEAAMLDHTYFKQTTERIIQTREWVAKELKDYHFHVIPSQANFLFVRHNDHQAKDLYERLKQEGVVVRHFDKDPIANYLRITIGTDEEMKLLFTKLAFILDEG